MSPRASLSRELIFAYLAAGAKVGSWVVVSALVYRYLGSGELGTLALARSTVGLLAYAGAGIGPALVHRIAQAMNRPRVAVPVAEAVEDGSRVLAYASPGTPLEADRPSHGPYSNGMVVATVLAVLAFYLGTFYAELFTQIHRVDWVTYRSTHNEVRRLVLWLTVGTGLRLISDVPGAVIQTSRWLWLDYAILAVGDCLWAGMAWARAFSPSVNWLIDDVGASFALASAAVLGLRFFISAIIQRRWAPAPRLIQWSELTWLFTYGSVLVAAQLADFLYAPTDYVLINHFLGAEQVAVYAPAVQFDSALALVVTVLASVLLPRTALAHAAGDAKAVRRLYIRGTLVSIGLLIPLALVLYFASGVIFRLWLGNEMPQTRQILPLVLLHTLMGGSSIVGRSVLLGMGRVKAYAVSVLIAGAANVGLSWFFVAKLNMGLPGIVLGTIIVIFGRCVVWMPWYVMKKLKREDLKT